MHAIASPKDKYRARLNAAHPVPDHSVIMSETLSHQNGRSHYSNSSTMDHRNSLGLSSPIAARGRAPSSANVRPGSPGPNGASGVDSCEELLFKVIANVQGMKAERDAMIATIEGLQDEIERLNLTINSQQEEIRSKSAEVDRLNQVQARYNDAYAICLIDGDGYIFDKRFLVNGHEGGREAAAALTKHLHRDIDNTSTSLWTCVYYNHQGLKRALSKAQIVQEATFDEFCDGFRSASQLIHMMDVGRRKEAADEKIKEMLRMFATAPQTRVIYFGGGHDSGYGGALSHYQNLGLKDKIVILKGYSEIAYDLKNLTFRTLSSDGLFMQEKIDSEVKGSPQAPIVHPPAPIVISPTRSQNSVTSSYASAATLAVPLATPKQRSPSPGHTRRASRDAGRGQRRIDTSKPLHKQTPSICNYHVLSIRGCRNGADCSHAHDYALTDEQKIALREYMLTVPCDHGDQCINEACILGHRCPAGPGCPRYQKGICRFKADQHYDE